MFKVVYTGGKLTQSDQNNSFAIFDFSEFSWADITRQDLFNHKLQNTLMVHQAQRTALQPAGYRRRSGECYLVVRPDGDFELWQDSLHLQVPLCSINRRLQNVVRFGGRLRFLSENQQQNHQFHSRAEQNSELQTRRRLVSCANKTLLTESYIRCV